MRRGIYVDSAHTRRRQHVYSWKGFSCRLYLSIDGEAYVLEDDASDEMSSSQGDIRMTFVVNEVVRDVGPYPGL